MNDFRNICQKYDASVIQKLYKKITDNNQIANKDVFPVSLVQAIYDAVTGTRLDDILSHYNFLHLPYKGSKAKTRTVVPIAHRRTNLIITYRDYDKNTVVEQYIAEAINDEDWSNDDNWKTPFTEGNFTINVTDSQLENYLDNYLVEISIEEVIGNKVIQQVNKFFESEYGEQFVIDVVNKVVEKNINDLFDDAKVKKIVTDYLEQLDLSTEITESINNNINNYLTSEEGVTDITNVVNNYLNENLGDYLTEDKVRDIVKDYLDNYNLDDIISDKVQTAINNYMAGDDIHDLIVNKVNDYLTENLNEDELKQLIADAVSGKIDDAIKDYMESDAGKDYVYNLFKPDIEEMIGQFFEAMVKYVQDNERVIANALARHEQAITDLQNA